MKKETIKGDLLKLAKEGHFDAIVHGCNCFCRMGAGIARQIAEQFPGACSVDLNTKRADTKKLGDYTFYIEGPLVIINAYTQYGYDGRLRGDVDVDYDAIRTVMRKINKDFAGKRIGYPAIGAGLAGGNWEVISRIIDQELVDIDHTLVEYDPNA